MLSVDIMANSNIKVSMTNTVEEAIELLNLHKIRHIPILKSKAFIGIIDETILKNSNPSTIMRELVNKGVKKFVNDSDHILEAAKVMVDNELSIVPVLSQDQSYLGLIKIEDLFNEIVSKFGLNTEGSLLIIEMQQQDYQLSELIRILELENVHLFSVLVSLNYLPVIEVTLKTDIKDINSILQTLERYSYKVKAYFENDQYSHQLKDRYESLMSYLNV